MRSGRGEDVSLGLALLSSASDFFKLIYLGSGRLREFIAREGKYLTGKLRCAAIFTRVLDSAKPSENPKSQIYMGSKFFFESPKSIHPRIHNILLHNSSCRNAINPFSEAV